MINCRKSATEQQTRRDPFSRAGVGVREDEQPDARGEKTQRLRGGGHL